MEISEEMSRLDDLFADYPPHLTVTQVSEVLGIGRATTYTWLNAGTIPAYRVGSAWVILRDELKDAIASGRNLPPPGEPAPPPLSSEDGEQ